MKTIKIYCKNCQTLLYLYQKENIKGHLIKCYKDRIIKDYTKRDLRCPNCGEQFAREVIMHGKPAHKIIQGKVFVRK